MALLATGLVTGLVTGLMAGALTTPAQAQERFDNEGIQFDTPTIIEFEFAGSDGVYQSTFGVENLATGERTPLLREERSPNSNDNVGVVANSLAEFEFAANTPYAFYLESTYNGQFAGLLYSTNSRNPNNQRLLSFDGGMSGLNDGGTLLQWDDTGSLLVPPAQQDRDFNDFLVYAGGHIACPYAQLPEQEGFSASSQHEGDYLALVCRDE